jgi:hypothetical protein
MRITPQHPLYGRIVARPDVQRQLEARNAAVDLRASRADAPKPTPSKLYNVRTRIGDETFDSRLEARLCETLRARYGPENIVRQVSLPLGSGGQRMRVDYLIVHERFDDGTFRAELADAKGYATAGWKTKARRLDRLHKIKVRLLR